MKKVEVLYKEYECGEPGCCYEDWYELVVDGKPVTRPSEYGYEMTKRFSSIPYDLDDILESITGETYDVEFKHE